MSLVSIIELWIEPLVAVETSLNFWIGGGCLLKSTRVHDCVEEKAFILKHFPAYTENVDTTPSNAQGP